MAFFVLIVMIFHNNMLVACTRKLTQSWFEKWAQGVVLVWRLVLSRVHVGTFAVEEDGSQRHWLALGGRELRPAERRWHQAQTFAGCVGLLHHSPNEHVQCHNEWYVTEQHACTHTLIWLEGKIKLPPLNNLQQKIHWKLQDSLSRRQFKKKLLFVCCSSFSELQGQTQQ